MMAGERSSTDTQNTESVISRRDLLAAATVVATTAIASAAPLAKAVAAPATGAFEPKPLPFDPAKLNGISEKLIVSHHNNNYAGAVKRLNSIQAKIKQLPPDAAPYQMGSLKREELMAMNSMILHEI